MKIPLEDQIISQNNLAYLSLHCVLNNAFIYLENELCEYLLGKFLRKNVVYQIQFEILTSNEFTRVWTTYFLSLLVTKLPSGFRNAHLKS